MQLGTYNLDAYLSLGMSGCCRGLIVTVAEVLDHSSFHRELDQVNIQAIRTWQRMRSSEMDLRGEHQIETIGNSICE